MEERGQASDKSRHLDGFLHSLWVQQRALNEIQKRVEVPFCVILG